LVIDTVLLFSLSLQNVQAKAPPPISTACGMVISYLKIQL
jgi:hypothetical protein